MADQRGRDTGRSFIGGIDTHTKTARPTSVGPHHARDHQEDPDNPGIRPEEGYAQEIETLNQAREDRAPPVAPTPDTSAGDTEKEKLAEEERAPPVAPTPPEAKKPTH